MTWLKNEIKFKWNIVQRKGILGGIFATIVGGGYLAYESLLADSIWYPFRPLSSDSGKKEPSYIYIPQNRKDYAGTNENGNANRWWHKREHVLHWHLLKLARSKDRQVRHIAIKALAELPHLDDSEFREIAQACDMRTAVGLARTHGSDLRFFLLPPLLVEKSQKNIEAELKEILASLPLSDVSKRIQHITQYAIRTGYHKLEGDNQVGEWLVWEGLNEDDDHSQHRPYTVPKETVKETCLQALLNHSTIPHHRKRIVDNAALPLLHRICQEKQENHITESLVAQIIGNLALDKDLHTSLFMGGWIYTLTKWSRSPHLALSLPASRALANMDNDKISDAVYEDGIYLLHPQLRGREKHINADIIFIHGLLGGAFRTWRQNDRAKPAAENTSNVSSTESITSTSALINKEQDNSLFHATLGVVKNDYTFCWPKDWLAQECPHLRILAVDYYSNFSIWKDKCYVEDESRTLMGRGNDVLMKLLQARIGTKPVIWVTHSMGGLLVKQILLQAAASEDEEVRKLLTNTVGIVFYSVPHRGSSLADMKSGIELLLLPTKEVKELKKNSPFLMELHEKFKRLTEKHNISCLSFGETKKTNLGLKWSALMVPQESSDPKIGEYHAVSENHLNICKPETRDSLVYQILVKFIHDHVPHTLIENLLEDHTSSAEDMETSVVMGLVQ